MRSPNHSNAAPAGVADRLARLRQLYVPERDRDARQRLAAERPATAEPIATVVVRRLGELRALCDLARYLSRRG